MRIDRNNYEEFFILYVDNELSADQRLMVEEFITLHPDLAEELQLFQQTTFSPEEIVFDNKESLLINSRQEEWEEFAILFNDNEIELNKKKDIESMMITEPAFKAEVDLFSQLKFQPDLTVVFPGKESLYRMPLLFPWKKLAVAAIFLLVAGGGWLYMDNQQISTSAEPSLANDIKTNVRQIPDQNNVGKDNSATVTKNVAAKNSTVQIQPSFAQQPSQKKTIKKEEPMTADLRKNDLPKEVSNELPVPVRDYAVINTTVEVEKNSEYTLPKEDVKANAITTVDVTDPSFARNTDEGGNKKFQIRGLLRKATRVFEKTTNFKATDDDGRLLIGSIAVKL